MTYKESKYILSSMKIGSSNTEREAINYITGYIDKLKMNIKKAKKEKKRWKHKYLELFQQNVNQLSFIDDYEKMIDFVSLTKEEFLQSYSYLTEEEYDATVVDYEKIMYEED